MPRTKPPLSVEVKRGWQRQGRRPCV